MRTGGADEEGAPPLGDEAALAAAALALGAEEVPLLSAAERDLANLVRGIPTPPALTAAMRDAIGAGGDPLGDAFRRLRSPAARRPLGATYTPAPIVAAMVDWAADQDAAPARVIDPGSGSARFAVAAGRRFERAELVAVEIDPLAGLIGRAALAAAGLADRARVELVDYRSFRPPAVDGRTLYLGNPPYVRHHLVAPAWKEWLVETARRNGVGEASRLAGLHAHFFLATLEGARPGDVGAFITSSEWLDTNYGALVRRLVLGPLGGEAVHVLEPEVQPFEDAATTGAITCFHVGRSTPVMRMRRVRATDGLARLSEGEPVRRERLAEARRWSPLTRPARAMPEGHVELGELCRVHRGAVTGANATWIVGRDAPLPDCVLHPTVTRARELFDAGASLASDAALRLVADIPPDLDAIDDPRERGLVERFLRRAKRQGAAEGYIARNRRVWWSIGLRAPAPILATYMARRPPAFVMNRARARHINIAHGLYPRVPLGDDALAALARELSRSVSVHDGRTYSGGLTKFEPREMERLPVPAPELLTA